MGRFSPTVLPNAEPGGLGLLARALQQGVGAYQGAQDRTMVREDAERKRRQQTAENLVSGVDLGMEDPGPSFVEALTGAMQGQPQMPSQPPSGVTGSFNQRTGTFHPVGMLPEQQAAVEGFPVLRSGEVSVDFGVPAQIAAAKEAMDAERRAKALRAAGLPTAASISDQATNALLTRQPRLHYTGPDRANPATIVDLDTGDRRVVAGSQMIPDASGAGGGGLAGVQRSKIGAMYEMAAFASDALEAIRHGDNFDTPDVVEGDPSGPTLVHPSWAQRMGGKIVGSDTRGFFTEDQQQQLESVGTLLADQWVRFTSGAAINEKEVERVMRSLIPMPGDKPGNDLLKQRAREHIVRALQIAAGRGQEVADDATFASVLTQIQRVDPEAAAILRRGRAAMLATQGGGSSPPAPGRTPPPKPTPAATPARTFTPRHNPPPLPR